MWNVTEKTRTGQTSVRFLLALMTFWMKSDRTTRFFAEFHQLSVEFQRTRSKRSRYRGLGYQSSISRYRLLMDVRVTFTDVLDGLSEISWLFLTSGRQVIVYRRKSFIAAQTTFITKCNKVDYRLISELKERLLSINFKHFCHRPCWVVYNLKRKDIFPQSRFKQNRRWESFVDVFAFTRPALITSVCLSLLCINHSMFYLSWLRHSLKIMV